VSPDVFAEDCLLDSSSESERTVCESRKATGERDKAKPGTNALASQEKQACQALDTAYKAQHATSDSAAH
jgi:hypothetical protein